MIAGNFEPGFFVEHFIKDMGIALAESRRMNLALPGLALAEQLYRAVAGPRLRPQGHPGSACWPSPTSRALTGRNGPGDRTGPDATNPSIPGEYRLKGFPHALDFVRIVAQQPVLPNSSRLPWTVFPELATDTFEVEPQVRPQLFGL